MADFFGIVLWLLKQEDRDMAGVVVNLADGQGRTRWGIGEHSHPSLPPDFYTKPAKESLNDAIQLYRTNEWKEMWGEKITDDPLAASLFSFCVNSGTQRTIRMLQDCIGVLPDGLMGPITIKNVNAYNPMILTDALRAAQEDYYRDCVTNQPTDIRFLDGWLARVKRIYPNLD